MDSLLIKNALIVSSNGLEKKDILCENQLITLVKDDIDFNADITIDAKNLVAIPSLIKIEGNINNIEEEKELFLQGFSSIINNNITKKLDYLIKNDKILEDQRVVDLRENLSKSKIKELLAQDLILRIDINREKMISIILKELKDKDTIILKSSTNLGKALSLKEEYNDKIIIEIDAKILEDYKDEKIIKSLYKNEIDLIDSDSKLLLQTYTHLYEMGLDISDVVKVLCENPARIYKLDDKKGRIQEGFHSDIILFDLEAQSDNLRGQIKIVIKDSLPIQLDNMKLYWKKIKAKKL